MSTAEQTAEAGGRRARGGADARRAQRQKPKLVQNPYIVRKIPLVTVVFNNNAFGNVKLIQEESYGGRTIASDLTNPDFAALARSYGAEGVTVSTVSPRMFSILRALTHSAGSRPFEL